MSKYHLCGILPSLLCAALLFSSLLSAEQLALPSSDLIAPSIELDQVNSTDSPQKISAKVTDNRGIHSVTLFYRQIGKQLYQPIRMSAQPNENRYFSRAIDIPSPGIEYYIQAMDLAGNTVLSGQSFSPVVVTVKENSSTKPITSMEIKVQQTQEDFGKEGNRDGLGKGGRLNVGQ